MPLTCSRQCLFGCMCARQSAVVCILMHIAAMPSCKRRVDFNVSHKRVQHVAPVPLALRWQHGYFQSRDITHGDCCILQAAHVHSHYVQLIQLALLTLITCKTTIPLLTTNSAIVCDSAGCMPVFARTSSRTCECVRCPQVGLPCVARPVQEGWQDSQGAGGLWAPLMSPRNTTKWISLMWLSR